MMYRNSREYRTPSQRCDYELLRSWLQGTAGLDSLKEWLRKLYN